MLKFKAYIKAIMSLQNNFDYFYIWLYMESINFFIKKKKEKENSFLHISQRGS